MDIPKGGRGKKADYETTHARIPVALKELVTGLSNEYKQTGIVPSMERQPTLLDIMTKDEAIVLANSLVKGKKSLKVSLSKLLTALYQTDVTID
jgi:hypothetical protein